MELWRGKLWNSARTAAVAESNQQRNEGFGVGSGIRHTIDSGGSRSIY